MKARLGIAACVLLLASTQAFGSSTLALWTDQTTFNPSGALQKDVAAKSAWHKVVPQKYVKSRWVYDLEGQFNTPKVMSEAGITYVVGGDCKPYDCMAYHTYYVIEPGGHRAYGAVLTIRNGGPTCEYFGNADALQHEWLREQIVDTLHAVGITQAVN